MVAAELQEALHPSVHDLDSNFELVFVSRIPQIRLKKSVTEILLRRSFYGNLVTEILWQKLPHTLIPIVFVKLCPPRTDGSCLARDTSTHTKLSSLPSLVINLHDFGQLYHFQNSSDHQKIRSTVSRIPQIRLKRSVTEILWRGDLVTKILLRRFCDRNSHTL